MANLITPIDSYYDNEDNWGNYQYISLNQLVNNFMTNFVGDDKLLSNIKRYNVLYHMKRGMQEFSYDALKEIKVVELEISETNSIHLPHDYVSYVRVSIVGEDGLLRPLSMNNKTTMGKAYLQDHEYNILFDHTTGNPLEAELTNTEMNYKAKEFKISLDAHEFGEQCYSSLNDTRYNINPSQNANGYFNIDKRAGRMSFSSNIFGNAVVIEYVSDGLEYDSDNIKIHKFAEQALYNYVKYNLLNNKYGVQEYIVNRAKKDYDISLRNSKVRLMEIRLNEAIFLLNGRKKWLK